MPHNSSPVADDNYDDGPTDGGQDNKEPASEETRDREGETALLPKSLCPGMNPGDSITLKIVSVQEDSYQVSYTKKGSTKESASAETADDVESDSMYA